MFVVNVNANKNIIIGVLTKNGKETYYGIA